MLGPRLVNFFSCFTARASLSFCFKPCSFSAGSLMSSTFIDVNLSNSKVNFCSPPIFSGKLFIDVPFNSAKRLLFAAKSQALNWMPEPPSAKLAW